MKIWLDPSQLAAEFAALLPLHHVSVNLYFEYILHSNYDVQPPAHVPFVLPLACQPFDLAWQVHNLGSLNVDCLGFGALHWLDEHLANSSHCNPRFGTCCLQGNISLPPLQHPPPELLQLLTS
jgi:hypothetical protein